MSFLETMQKIGFGTRGPYGRQVSGAQRLSGTLQGMKAKDERKKLAQMGKTFYQSIRSHQENNPDEPLTEKLLQQKAADAGAKTYEHVAMLLGGVQKAGLEKETRVTSPGQEIQERTKALGGKFNKVGGTKPLEKTLEKDEKITSLIPTWKVEDGEVITSEAPYSELGVKKKQGWKEGVPPSVRKKKDGAGGKPTDFETSYQQFIKKPGNENVGRAEFKTKQWTKAGGALTDNAAYERIQDHVYVSGMDPSMYPILTAQYEKVRNRQTNGKQMNRNDAMNIVLNAEYKQQGNTYWWKQAGGRWTRIK